MLGAHGHGVLEREFNLIFDNLLPGKKLAGVSFNELGLLKVLVRDELNGEVFDIDQMSSGEKGLVLTFLFIRLTVEHGGVILLDEPGLHLNSAVQGKILPFLIEHCIKPFSIQAFVCTHSPEIVRDSFENESCGLFHLRSGADLTPILKQDLGPLFEVFERLGNSTADVLSTRGNIYVEGEHDSAILQSGFASILTGYKITSLGGRGDIEREVPVLQAEEAAHRLTKRQLFILDNDNKPTKLKNSASVRVHQLKRNCIENYLIDETIIFDLLGSHAQKPVGSRGTFPTELEELAFTQIQEIALREIYESVTPENPGIRSREIKGKDLNAVARVLADRLYKISEQVKAFDPSNWSTMFVGDCERKAQEVRTEWKNTWRERSDGKVLIDELYIKYEINMKKVEFKKEIMKRMASAQTDEWRVIRDVLSTELS